MQNSEAGVAARLWSWLAPDPHSQKIAPRSWIALALLSLFIMGSGITSVPVMDRDEARYAQATRQMIETGDFIDIRFQEDARHVKPAGIYWMQAASTAMFGGADAPIAAHRLPSLFGALIAILGTAWLGARMGGAGIGLLAGLFLAASIVMQIEARTAKTDAMLLAMAVIAQAALFMIVRRGAGDKLKFWGAPALFWAAHGAALMIKGPIIAMVSAATIAFLVFVGKQKDWLRHLHILKGVLLTAIIALPWVVAITVMTDGAFLEDSIGHALLGKVGKADDSHGGPPGYHLAVFMGVYWPGALMTGLACAYLWLKRKRDDVFFLAAWILPSWIIFELIGTKLPHYVLPVYPAIAILGGFAVMNAKDLLARPLVRRLHWASVATFAVLGFVAAAMAPFAATQLLGVASPIMIATAIAGLIATAFGIWLGVRPAPEKAPLFMFAIAVFYALLFGFAAPRLTPLWPSQHIAQFVSNVSGCAHIEVATAGYREPSNVFYNGTQTFLAVDGAAAAERLQQSQDCTIVFVDQREQERFDAAARSDGLELRALGTVTGINTVKNRDLSLTAYVAARSPLEKSE